MFPTMHEILAPAEQGEARIIHYDVTSFDAAMATMRGIRTYSGRACVLKVNGRTMMSDTNHERATNCEVVRQARGDMLIGGLGLGMILHPIMAKPEVRHVTVIEQSQDVIDLVSPTLPRRDDITIIVADLMEWKPPRGMTWDVIYFDIWPDICIDNLGEIATLHRRFGRRKRPGGWMDSWCRSRLLARRRRERRQEACYRW